MTREVVMSSFWIISRSCCSRDRRWSRISCTLTRIRFRFCSTCLSSGGGGEHSEGARGVPKTPNCSWGGK